MSHPLKDWVLVTRPWSFPASSMPVLVTIAWVFCSGIEGCWWLGAAALINIIFVHAAGNLWSDYHDFKKGVDREDTYGVKAIASGQFTPQEIWHYSLILQVMAVVMGCTMVYLTGLTLLWIGLVGIALSLLYPPLKYIALGDVVIAICYSVLPMLGVTFMLTGQVIPDVLWLAPPVGLITVGILHANNTRDIETDSRAHIHTFSMLTGRRVAVGIYVFEVLFPYLWMIVVCVLNLVPYWALLSLLSLPIAIGNVRLLLRGYKQSIESYAQLDEATAKLQMAFSLLLILGLVLSSLI